MYAKKAMLVGVVAAAMGASSMVMADEIEDIKAQMADLQKRLDKMESSKGAGVTSGNSTVRLSVSGQVNRGLLYVDDGDKTKVHHVDNDASSTRIRFIGEADPSDTLTVGAAMEVQFESNSTATVDQTTGSGGAGDDNFTQRRLEVYFADKNRGKVWIGQGWTASEGSSEVSLSGTDLAGYSDSSVFAGGQRFRFSDGTLSSVTLKSVMNNMDGLGRTDRIRYDTPSFGGATLSLGHTQGDGADAAVHYKAKYDGMQVAAALAYVDPDSSTTDDQINGSLSVLLDGGFNVTVAGGSQDTTDGRDPSFYYLKLGYKMGPNAVSVDYNRAEDVAASGDEGTVYGAQYVRTVKDWSTEMYVGIRNHELDRSGSDFDDVLGVLAGARVKF